MRIYTFKHETYTSEFTTIAEEGDTYSEVPEAVWETYVVAERALEKARIELEGYFNFSKGSDTCRAGLVGDTP